MTTKLVSDGEVWNHTPAGNVLSGAVIVMGATVGVAITDIAATKTGAVAVSKTFQLPKKAADTFAQGAKVYWDAVTNGGECTTTVGANTLMGRAESAAAAATTTLRVCLNMGA